MLPSQAVDDKVGLVFSWDPRSRTWIKERGPEDGAQPAYVPIDEGAVQTYFLDPATGKWNPTILGFKARQISVELKDAYRAPFMAGLAVPEPKTAAVKTAAGRRSMAPIGGAIAVLLLLLAGGGIVASQTLLATPPPLATAKPSDVAAAASASAAPNASASAAPSQGAATAVPTQAPVRTPAPPTPPPQPQTIRLSVKLPSGTQVFYSGPAAVAQNGSFQGIFSVVLPSGQGGNENLTVYLGNPSGQSTSVLGTKPDANGNYVLTIRTFVPKGDQTLSVLYGTQPGIHQLGSITIQ